jgi:Spy/CpxP family protein refolding chaperone
MSAETGMGRPHVQALLLLTVVLVIGVLAGIAMDRAFLDDRFPRPPRRHGPPGQHLPPEFSEMNLTAAQSRQIQAILDRNRPRTDAVLEQFVPRLRAVTDSVRTEIRAVLTPEQQKAFDRQPPFLIGGQGGPRFGDGDRRGPGGPPPPAGEQPDRAGPDRGPGEPPPGGPGGEEPPGPSPGGHPPETPKH